MSPETWSIIGMGIAILVAIAAANRSLRREMNERIGAAESRLNVRIDGLQNGLNGLNGRMDALSERVGDVRERLGRVEGLLDGIGLIRRKAAGKRSDDEERAATGRPSP